MEEQQNDTTATGVAESTAEQTRAAKALENLRMRLLDLTARNRLINLRHTKTGSLRVIDELPDQLVETLLAEKEMRFLSVPEPTRDELIAAGYIEIDPETEEEIRLKKDPSAEEWAKHLGLATAYEVPEPSADATDDKHADTAIQTLLYPYELEARLKNLLHTAESAIEETGANILYMALGFLEWPDPGSTATRIAPLFLVPVRLHKGRLDPATKTYIYTLSYSGEDIIPNLSLREKLRIDFALVLPELDENSTPEAYFAAVRAMIQDNQPSWRVRRFVTLTLLNFSKLLMYLDLDPARWPEHASILVHPVVSRFLANYDADVDEKPDFGFGEEHPIDEIADIHSLYPLIDDADSSQHSALIDAVDGKNLVIEGPPGTGKSQTITNLIAAAIAQGKRVLFVAEKLAALEVVRRRLDNAGLGEFCLELHSHKSQKSKVLEEIDQRIKKRGAYRNPQEIDIDIARYEDLKAQLKAHAERINQTWKSTGKTLHEIFMAATRYRELIPVPPDSIHPDGYDGDNLDPTAQRRTADQVKAFGSVYQAVADQLDGEADLQRHPWYGVRNAELQMFDLDRVTAELGDWQQTLVELAEQRTAIAAALSCDVAEIADTLSGLTAMLTDLDQLPTLAGDEHLDRLPALRGDLLVNVRRYLALFEHIQAAYINLDKVVDHAVLRDLSQVDGIAAAGERLKQLAAPSVDLATLVGSIKRLRAVLAGITELEEPLTETRAAVGNTAAAHLQPSASGLQEFATFIELVANLPAEHWKRRDDTFDNEELDQLLPRLRQEIHHALDLRQQIAPIFDPDRLPSSDVLQQLGQTLANSGLFSWFSSQWRGARKQLLHYAASPQVKASALIPVISKAAAFAAGRDDLADNVPYRSALGKYFDGLTTDVSALETIRTWYRAVRHEYGIGFGNRVALGDALLTLPVNLARALRSLADRGLPEQLRSQLTELQGQRPMFAAGVDLHNADAPLFGDSGCLLPLLNDLEASLHACTPVAAEGSATVSAVLDRIEQLKSLRKSVATWDKSDFDRKVFRGQLGLQVGLEADNRSGLLAAHNTFKLATILDTQLQTSPVQSFLYANPTTSTFEQVHTLRNTLRASYDTQVDRCRIFSDTTELDTGDWLNQCGDRLDALITRNQSALQAPGTLQNWLDYVRIRDQLEAMGLLNLAKAVEQAALPLHQLDNAYKAGVYDLLAREILREQPELGRFSGHSQNALQEQFASYDNKLKRLQCERIAWKVDQHTVPNGNPGPRASDRSGLYLLQHETGKKTRHVPIRQLLMRAGEAMSALKPCFMMGPMSVAQYLAPGQIEFDLLVMDEASQIKPQDALGAIARGAQIVIVGDPKQLPPTSFFDRAVDDDEDDPTGIEESESILDATLPMFRARRLRWHYRSQHESLIAFSNHSFYDSDLVLFPSPHRQTDSFGIQYSRIQRGCFINRRNLEEARVISEAVREHFLHRPDESLGVVAMSADQRSQIEGAIETLAKEDTAFRELLEEDGRRENGESLFIKNLENVQGDERDVIFVSMTYGPQEPGGNVYQRFGPINSDIGWRRLNVLFTRSKKRMHIFSSMGSDDITAGSGAKRGVHALRNFLSYCETGILHHTERDTGRAPDSDFEIAVANALQAEGFECVPQVGVAGFFIDVAVVDPGKPGRYLMGIECDGATYHSAKSVRDRDRLRQAILERLGWRIRRIWSTDWFKNPHAELKPIVRELHALKSSIQSDDADATPTEEYDIQEIVAESDAEDARLQDYITKDGDLRSMLLAFDQDIVRPDLPDTPQQKRLLRPAMLEALLEYTPTSKTEFIELIPSYLRHATEAAEGKYLDQVFEIINASLDTPVHSDSEAQPPVD